MSEMKRTRTTAKTAQVTGIVASADVKTVLARSMSEAQLLHHFLDLAKALHWKTAHFRPAMTTRGWRTPVEGDGAGYPDLILLRRNRGLAVELKREKVVVPEAQQEWLDAFERAGFEACVWRPGQWVSGEIATALR